MSVHFSREVDKLKKMVLHLGTLVEENLFEALKAVEEQDVSSVEKVAEKDKRIDDLEVEVEEECLKILALYQPVASDLRYIVATLKINNDLERIGDMAVNIAQKVETLSNAPESLKVDFTLMADKVRKMVRHSLDALVNRDYRLALKVCQEDDEIDSLHKETYNIVNSLIQKTPEKSSILLHNLNISRNLERIGDHATNIAEDVLYMLQGNIVRHGSDFTYPPVP